MLICPFVLLFRIIILIEKRNKNQLYLQAIPRQVSALLFWFIWLKSYSDFLCSAGLTLPLYCLAFVTSENLLVSNQKPYLEALVLFVCLFSLFPSICLKPV